MIAERINKLIQGMEKLVVLLLGAVIAYVMSVPPETLDPDLGKLISAVLVAFQMYATANMPADEAKNAAPKVDNEPEVVKEITEYADN